MSSFRVLVSGGFLRFEPKTVKKTLDPQAVREAKIGVFDFLWGVTRVCGAPRRTGRTPRTHYDVLQAKSRVCKFCGGWNPRKYAQNVPN